MGWKTWGAAAVAAAFSFVAGYLFGGRVYVTGGEGVWAEPAELIYWYQTLIAGIAAVLGAAFTVRAVRDQIAQVDRLAAKGEREAVAILEQMFMDDFRRLNDIWRAAEEALRPEERARQSLYWVGYINFATQGDGFAARLKSRSQLLGVLASAMGTQAGFRLGRLQDSLRLVSGWLDAVANPFADYSSTMRGVSELVTYLAAASRNASELSGDLGETLRRYRTLPDPPLSFDAEALRERYRVLNESI